MISSVVISLTTLCILAPTLIKADMDGGGGGGGDRGDRGGRGGGGGGGGGGGRCNLDENCWQAAHGCTLADGFPFDRRTPITCDECVQLCQKKQQGQSPYICKSAVYDAQWKTCDIFAVQARSPQRLTPFPGRTYFQPTGAQCGGASSAAPNGTGAPAPSDCPSGQKAVLSIFQNSTSPSLAGGKQINADSPDKCGLLCVQNQDDKGQPTTCKAASFAGGKCTFSDQPPGADSVKGLQPGSDPNALYLEKKCYPADQAGQCSTIILDPHHVLVGYNRKTVDAKSYEDCLAQCLAAKDFKCNSGQYYSDAGPTENCVLNEETRDTKPDVYLATDDQNIYFEPKCGAGRKLIFAAKKVKAKLSLKDIPLEHGEWTLWSDCTDGKTEKHRYRNCRETRIYKCPKETAPCTASDKSSKDGFISKILHSPPQIPCEPLLDESGKKRCDMGVRYFKNNGTRSYCKPTNC